MDSTALHRQGWFPAVRGLVAEAEVVAAGMTQVGGLKADLVTSFV